MKKQQSTNKRIVVAGGGTGGHIMPAIAVAETLRQQGHEVFFIGSANGPEKSLVELEEIPFYGISAGKLRRYFSWENLTDAFRVVTGFFQARSILARLQPDVIFAKGGYVCVPVVYAAAFLEIPIVAHESDVVMGLANRLTVEKAALVCTGFPVKSYPRPLRSKLRFTGNPVRQIFTQRPDDRKALLKRYGLTAVKPVVLFMGGSQGARAINELVTDNLHDNLLHFQIIHLTGPAEQEAVLEKVGELPTAIQRSYKVYGFAGDELAELMAVSDIVVSRASATVLTELAALGKPSVLIPLPSAASDHQRANAKVFADKEAAVVLEQDELTSVKLTQVLVDLMADKEELRRLGRTIKFFYSADAAKLIAEAVVSAAK